VHINRFEQSYTNCLGYRVLKTSVILKIVWIWVNCDSEFCKDNYLRFCQLGLAMDIKIREAIKEDIPILLELEQLLVKAERPFDPTIREDPVWYHDIPRLVSDTESRFVVAEIKGNIVACAFGTKKQPRHYLDHDAYAYLGLMVTIADCRGKGINGLLIEDLKQWATSCGLYEMRLTVYDGNQSAIHAYEKSGFVRHIAEMRFRAPDK